MEDQHYVTTAAGVEMPGILYGTAWKKERTEELVVQAVLAGFRGIDTACQPKHYEESLVGAALQRLNAQGVERKSLFLQTKFTPLEGQDPNRVPYDKSAPVAMQVAQSFEVSKQNLQTDFVDSFVLHSPVVPYRNLLKVWEAMEAIQKAGGARQLGISNCYDLEWLKRLHADAGVKPAVVQNRFYRDTGYDAPLRQWCADHGVIYQSFWTLTANPFLIDGKPVRTLAKKYNKTAAQIFFRYLSQSGVVPLTGTTSLQHMKEDLGIFDITLTSEEMERVGRLLNQGQI